MADVRLGQTPAVIQRDAVSRRLDVQLDVRGRDVDAVVADVEQQLDGLSFPMEYHAEVLSTTTADQIGLAQVLGVGLAAVLAAFLVLQAAFRSWVVAALVALALPVALAGGLVAAAVSGAALNMGTLLGLLAVLGLAARRTVLLVADLQAAHAASGDHGAAVQRVAREHLAPATRSAAAVAALALPFAVLGPRAGLELVQPLAVVVLGGLVSTLVVTLFLLPVLYAAVAPPPPAPEEGPDDGTDAVPLPRSEARTGPALAHAVPAHRRPDVRSERTEGPEPSERSA